MSSLDNNFLSYYLFAKYITGHHQLLKQTSRLTCTTWPVGVYVCTWTDWQSEWVKSNMVDVLDAWPDLAISTTQLISRSAAAAAAAASGCVIQLASVRSSVVSSWASVLASITNLAIGTRGESDQLWLTLTKLFRSLLCLSALVKFDCADGMQV